jgi:hypothetical protein
VPVVAAAVCPHPPLLVPEIAAGAAFELDDLRAACDEAVVSLLTADPQGVLIVGAGEHTVWHSSTDYGSLAPWGLPIDIPLLPSLPRGDNKLPLGAMLGAWLLTRSPIAVDRAIGPAALTVARTASATEAAVVGSQRCASRRDRVALLVMGDGAACRVEKAPEYDDPRATQYDSVVAHALQTVDTDPLLALDPSLSDELRVAGRVPWQVLAGAVAADGRPWQGKLLYHDAPYGVGYFVACWTPA